MGPVIKPLSITFLLIFVGLGSLACSEKEPELNAVVIASDLSIGRTRLTFTLFDADGSLVKAPQVDVALYYPADESTSDAQEVTKARFRPWPLGDRGIYTADVNPEQAGIWRLEISATDAGGSSKSGEAFFSVKPRSDTPAIGTLALLSKNKTIQDVGQLEELTTAQPPDPDLYSMTIAAAISSGKPLVVTFSTPAFCASATCGPQVQVVEGIKDNYHDRANFIHVEIFDDPHLIQGDLANATTSETVNEWGLLSEPWTFVVDQDGLVAYKFEAFTTAEEIEAALLAVLE